MTSKIFSLKNYPLYGTTVMYTLCSYSLCCFMCQCVHTHHNVFLLLPVRYGACCTEVPLVEEIHYHAAVGELSLNVIVCSRDVTIHQYITTLWYIKPVIQYQYKWSYVNAVYVYIANSSRWKSFMVTKLNWKSFTVGW